MATLAGNPFQALILSPMDGTLVYELEKILGSTFLKAKHP